jgi:hypothetical protein
MYILKLKGVHPWGIEPHSWCHKKTHSGVVDAHTGVPPTVMSLTLIMETHRLITESRRLSSGGDV